jgi:hypothetical protein
MSDLKVPQIYIQPMLPPYPAWLAKKLKGQEADYKIDKLVYIDKEVSKSSLGTPVYANLQFLGDSFTDNQNKTTTFKTLTFDSVIMTVNQQKNIVITAIQGRDGTVKEEIGKGDYSVTINGIITGSNGHYPIDEVKELKKMLDANKALQVVSSFLQNLDVNYLVIKDYDLPQETGGYSYQRFSINALSDNLQEIFIVNA